MTDEIYGVPIVWPKREEVGYTDEFMMRNLVILSDGSYLYTTHTEDSNDSKQQKETPDPPVPNVRTTDACKSRATASRERHG